MKKAELGKKIKLEYIAQINDGSNIDVSSDPVPIEIILGNGEISPVLEKEIQGMVEGDRKLVEVPSEIAFGHYNTDLILEVSKKEFPSDIDLKEDQQLVVKTANKNIEVSVLEVKEKTVTIDANHPLAGKDLLFDIKLLEVA